VYVICVTIFVFHLLCVCSLENVAKVRIELVKAQGLMMVHSLQRRAQETFSNMVKWLQARYLAEMKWYDI